MFFAHENLRQFINLTDRLHSHYNIYRTGWERGDIASYNLMLDSSKLCIPETTDFLVEYIKFHTK